MTEGQSELDLLTIADEDLHRAVRQKDGAEHGRRDSGRRATDVVEVEARRRFLTSAPQRAGSRTRARGVARKWSGAAIRALVRRAKSQLSFR